VHSPPGMLYAYAQKQRSDRATNQMLYHRCSYVVS
jgi:hypothetical protein